MAKITVEKLIKEYRQKITGCDEDIARATEKKREMRKSSGIGGEVQDASDYAEVLGDIRRLNACRQIYVQILADLDSLDYGDA